jgi:hypothetical protein
MRDTSDKTIWGHVEKIGKGTMANYNPDKKTITFCFKKDPKTTAEQIKTLRELLLKEIVNLGYGGRIKYNGEIIVENVEKDNVAIVKKNHQLIIHLNNKHDKKVDAESEKETV